mgnify:CR=1 FL=1
MNLILFLENELKNILNKLGYIDEVKLNVSNRPDLGDYQYNGCMKLAGIYKKNPKDIANLLKEELDKTTYFKDVNIAGPGFINLTLSDDLLTNYINKINEDFKINTYKIDTDETIFLDYGGANVAKELHAGHLRSPNIGEAIKRLCEEIGYKTISDVHLGDWGRPMGLILCELSKRYPELVFFDENYNGTYPTECPITLEELNEIYPYASMRAKEDKNYLEEARKFTTRLQNREKGIYDLWKTFYTLSVNDIKKIYTLIGCTFDMWEGEYDADPYIKPLLDYLIDNNYTEISDGATIINVKEESDTREIPPVILIKSDGGVLYDTTELATLYSRKQRFKFNKIIYLTDIRQELHFIEAFRAAYKTNIIPKNIDLEWYGFGTMNGPDGKPFKTRDGGVMSLNSLIELVKKETKKVIKDNIPDSKKDDVALKLALAAIKYGDLLPHRSTDYIFDPIKFSDINGKTGPYLLYNTVRMKSLINKCDIKPNKYIKISTQEERNIILNLLNLRNIMIKSFNDRSLNEICEYLYKLTNSYNAFYSNINVNNEKDLEKKESYITLTNLVYKTNMYLLNILAITVPDEI